MNTLYCVSCGRPAMPRDPRCYDCGFQFEETRAQRRYVDGAIERFLEMRRRFERWKRQPRAGQVPASALEPYPCEPTDPTNDEKRYGA